MELEQWPYGTKVGMTKLAPQQWPPDGSVPDYVQTYIDWLVDPSNVPHNKSQYARDHDVNRTTIARWEKDKRFKAALQEKCDDLNLSIDRTQEIINAIYRAAVGGDMKAATLYLQFTERLQPKRTIVEVQGISDLSDEELAALLAEHNINAAD